MKEAHKINTSTWLIPVLSAIIGLTGGVLGYSLQNYYAMKQEEQKNLIESRKITYTSWFGGQSKLQQYDDLLAMGKKEEADKIYSDYMLQVKEARFRIAIFSTKPVVEALASYYEKYFPTTSSNNYQKDKDDIKIYQQMRNEVFADNPEQKVDDRVLSILIFGIRLGKN